MCPMLDIQRRHAEVFRLRFGDRGPDGYPRKLTEAIRVTAPTERIVTAFTDVYGGDVTPFEEKASRDRWQAYLPTTSIPIMVLPGQSLQQWWERYKGSVCDRRCDGETEQKTGKTCMCPPDIEARIADKKSCSPTTRVNVLCPEVAVVGSGSFVTHGLIAAETLPQSIAVAEAALSRGLMVPASLMVSEVRGRNHFIYPQIVITGMSLHELMSGGVPATSELGATVGEQRALPSGNLTPVPQTATSAPSIAAQAEQVNEPPAITGRRSARPIPATGVEPRTAQDAQPSAPTAQELGRRSSDVFRADYDAAPTRSKTKVVDRLRHAVAYVATAGARCRVADCDDDQRRRIARILDDIEHGRITYTHDALDDTAGATFVMARPNHPEGDKTVTVTWADLAAVAEDPTHAEMGEGQP